MGTDRADFAVGGRDHRAFVQRVTVNGRGKNSFGVRESWAVSASAPIASERERVTHSCLSLIFSSVKQR